MRKRMERHKQRQERLSLLAAPKPNTVRGYGYVNDSKATRTHKPNHKNYAGAFRAKLRKARKKRK